MVDAHRYIAVEGVIGSGHGALAHELAQAVRGRVVRDAGAENPFLVNYYKNPRDFAFATQMFYLLNRYRQQKELAQGELFAQTLVTDYLFERDRIFAYLSLNDAELALYEQLYKLLGRDPLPRPDLVIYLQTSTPVLVERLKRQNRLSEQGINEALLDNLVKAYNTFFFEFQAAPLLVVNANELDLAGSASDLSDVIERARAHRAGTQWYTPKK